MAKKVTFSGAIKAKNLEGLKEVVARAVKIYGGDAGAEPKVETVYGTVPFSAIIDDDTKWALVSVAYAEVLTAASCVSDVDDRKVEVAKLISKNAVIRAMVGDTQNIIDDLI